MQFKQNNFYNGLLNFQYSVCLFGAVESFGTISVVKNIPLKHSLTTLSCEIGARVNTKDNKWMTPLHRACASGSVVRIVTFLSSEKLFT